MHDPTVLVVDDDPDIRDSLTELLEEEGFPAVGVAHGRAALDTVQHADTHAGKCNWQR